MNIKTTKLCMCALGGLLISAFCSAMDKARSGSAVLAYDGKKESGFIVLPNSADSRTIRPVVESEVDSPLKNVICRTTSGIFDLEEARVQIMQSYNEVMAWLDDVFPNGKNQKELEDRYGPFVFSYKQCLNSNLEMRISSADEKNTLTVTINRKGWPVEIKRTGFKPSNTEIGEMYASSNALTCFIRLRTDSEGKTWVERYKESWK